MPVHDWTRADEPLVHGFLFAWRVHLSAALNTGALPETHYAQTATVDLSGGPPRTYAKGCIFLHRVSDHRPVARIETVEPADKSSSAAVAAFVRRVVDVIEAGMHLLVADLFPPGRHDPGGMHQAVWRHFGDDYVPPADKPLIAATYDADGPTAYLEPLAVGDPLPAMPLFIAPERYVNLPLKPAYDAAYRGVPGFWRDVVEGRETAV